MSKLPVEARALAFALANPPSPQTTASMPGTRSRASSPRPAIRRCCNAWKRAFDAYMAKRKPDSCSEIFAAGPASVAYCNAMPVLSGFDGIRDFIACVAHGVLIGAIKENRAGQLLYAAQVALATVQREAKTPASGQRMNGRAEVRHFRPGTSPTVFVYLACFCFCFCRCLSARLG